MLKKLLKHEFKTTSKLVLPLYLVLVVLTIFGRIVAQNFLSLDESNPSNGFIFFNASSLTIYILGLFAIYIAMFIYFVMRFYKNLFSDEGYLMHTLPVTSWQLLGSKLIVSFVWTLAEVLIILLSLFCIFANHKLFSLAEQYISAYGGFDNMVVIYTGLHAPACIILGIYFVLISILSGLLLPYTCVCIGQLWEKHKVAGGFLSYFGIIIIMQILQTIFSAMNMVSTGSTLSGRLSNTFLFSSYIFGAVLSTILTVVYFIASGLIMKKKVNLD